MDEDDMTWTAPWASEAPGASPSEGAAIQQVKYILCSCYCLPPLAEAVDKRVVLLFFLRRFQSRVSNVNIGRQYDLKTFFPCFIIVREVVISGTTAARGLKFWLQVALLPPIAT